jgi:diguanylate cyclase (GGDEF)-like protein
MEDAYKQKFKSLSILILSLILIGVLGFIDYVTAPYISFQIFYLIPIALVIWFVDTRMAILPFVQSIILWFLDDIMGSRSYIHPFIPYWNLFAKIIFFAIFIYIISYLKLILDREKMLARIDYLTEIANKRYFYESAAKEINRANRYKYPFTVAYLDLDDFKRVNDLFGHGAGDNLLRLTAQALKNSVRVADTVARIGGDEFAILLPETDYESAQNVIQRVQREISSIMDKNSLPATLSIGMITCANPPCTLESLVMEADNLMYLAKREGKNKIRHEIYGKGLAKI